jgi:hypothetical protein
LFYYHILQSCYTSHAGVDSAIVSGSPNKKHFSAAGAKAESAYGHATFGAKMSYTSRAANLAKCAKIAVQIL